MPHSDQMLTSVSIGQRCVLADINTESLMRPPVDASPSWDFVQESRSPLPKKLIVVAGLSKLVALAMQLTAPLRANSM